jgi:virulence factor Mce-like protein
MTRGRGTASIVASPVLVGAVTTLIVIVSVFLAYHANKGLPFVPTYDLSVRLPNGSNLVPGNEVRIGGFRVGVIDTIKPATQLIHGRSTPIAVANMKLDKTVEPIAVDSTVIVRARSALGLKYIQITPGHSKQTYKAGGTIPLAKTTLPVEFDDFLNTFNLQTRLNSRLALTGYGDAFAGRGSDLNTAIQALNPFFTFLRPVMANLNNPSTRLKDFFKNIGAVSAQVAPVARVQARLFTEMADTFQAISSCPGCLQQTIEKNPPTLDTAITSFRVQRPFLADFTDLSRRLQPFANVLPTALPRINAALAAGTRVLPQTVTLNRNTEKVFRALDDLVQDPSTDLALNDLRDTLGVLKPLINYVAPFQTVCSYTTTFFTGLGQHQSEGVQRGTAERVLLKSDNNVQDNRYSNLFNDRPVDVPKGVDPISTKTPTGALEAWRDPTYFHAIDSQGNADCEIGQGGYMRGPLGSGRYPPHNPVPGDDQYYTQFNRNFAGGSHTLNVPTVPGLVGTTFNGVSNLRKVP